MCPMCMGSGYEDRRGRIRCSMCSAVIGDASVQAHGDGAMDAQAKIVTEHIRSSARVKLAQQTLWLLRL